MKKILITFVLIISIFTLTGCNNKKYIDEINYSDLQNLLSNKETFILDIIQDGCSYCSTFSPRFEGILEEYEIPVKQLNFSNITEKEYNKFIDTFGKVGTPTVIFIENGEEKSTLNRIVGDATKKRIISKLKSNGYIKEES